MSQADNNAEKTSLDTAVTYADVVRYTTALLAYDKQARHAQAAAMAAAHAMGLDPEETKELVEQMLEESNLEPIASHMAAAAASAGGKSKKGEKGSRVKKEKAAGSRTGKMSAWNLFATKVMHHIKGEHPDAKPGDFGRGRLMAKAGELWKGLPEEQKETFKKAYQPFVDMVNAESAAAAAEGTTPAHQDMIPRVANFERSVLNLDVPAGGSAPLSAVLPGISDDDLLFSLTVAAIGEDGAAAAGPSSAPAAGKAAAAPAAGKAAAAPAAGKAAAAPAAGKAAKAAASTSSDESGSSSSDDEEDEEARRKRKKAEKKERKRKRREAEKAAKAAGGSEHKKHKKHDK